MMKITLKYIIKKSVKTVSRKPSINIEIRKRSSIFRYKVNFVT